MKIRNLAFILNVAAVGMLALALLLAGLVWYGITLVLLFGFWAYFFFRRASWVAGIGFCGICAFAAFGVFATLPGLGQLVNFYFLIFSVLLSLAAYDLADLDARLCTVGESQTNHADRIRQHYTRLGLVLLAGLALAVFAFNWNNSLSFGWMSALVIFGAFGLGVIVHTLLRKQ